MGKLHNIIKYIIQILSCYKDFAEYQAKANAEDKLFNYVELLLIKDGGV